MTTETPPIRVKRQLPLNVACYLCGGMSPQWLRARIRAGEIEASEVAPRKWVVDEASLAAFLEKRRIRVLSTAPAST